MKRVKLNESTISMILGALVVVVVGALIINYFRGINRDEQVVTEEVSEEVVLVEENGQLVPEALPKVHTVAAGENLWEIAEKYYASGYNWVDIAQDNNLSNPNQIAAGQELNIPKTAVIKPIQITDPVQANTITSEEYTVKKGDHLWGIAVRAYGDGYQWVQIAQANNLENPNTIHPGNVLTLPGKKG